MRVNNFLLHDNSQERQNTFELGNGDIRLVARKRRATRSVLAVDRSLAAKMAQRNTGPLSVGYDEEFVNPLDDDFTCVICQVALREPVLTRCGHRFCRPCLEQCFSW